MVKDHLGKIHENIGAMCASYGISKSLFYSRIRHGLNLQDALTMSPELKGSVGNRCVDPFGNTYKSISEMCRAYGVSVPTFRARVAKGYSLDMCLSSDIDMRKYNGKRSIGGNR